MYVQTNIFQNIILSILGIMLIKPIQCRFQIFQTIRLIYHPISFIISSMRFHFVSFL